MRKWFLAGLACLAVVSALLQNSVFGDAPDAVQARLGQILKNQEKILVSLEEIKKELQIVKIRATQK